MLPRFLRPLVLAFGLLLFSPALPAATAQDAPPPPADLRPPTPSKEDEPPVITVLLLLIILGGVIISGNLIPSKRGHQD